MSDPDYSVGQRIWFLRDGSEQWERGLYVGRGVVPGRAVVSVGGTHEVADVQRDNIRPFDAR